MHDSCKYNSQPTDTHTHERECAHAAEHKHQSGEHEHPNNDKHSHEHINTHDHDHSHTHDHNHAHSHSSTHTHPDDSRSHEADGLSMEKAVALLSYMLQHNNHHADELSRTEKLLRASNETAPAASLSEAVHYYIHGNEKLAEALALLERKG